MNYLALALMALALLPGCGSNGGQQASAATPIEQSLQQSLNDAQRSVVKIRLLGDSVTWGLHVTGEADPNATPRTHSLSDARNNFTSPSWANLLRDYLQKYAGTSKKVIVANDGIIGTCSLEWLPGKQLLDNAVQDDDDSIILMIGTNDRGDTVQPLTPTKTYSNVRTIVEHLRDVRHKNVILMSANQVWQDESTLHYTMAQVRDAIKQVSIDCGVPYLDHFAVNELSDSIHPNNAGHYQMFLNIIKGLDI